MQGQLFTQDFLHEGIRETAAWKALAASEIESLALALSTIFKPIAVDASLNEAVTEDEIILKVLEAVGWTEYLRQQTPSGQRRHDVPDVLLFRDVDAKTAAMAERAEDRRYPHGSLIVESKRWQRALDRGDQTDRLDPGTPSNQILRYLSSVEIASDRAIRWGVLTNGRIWRLYWQGARSRAEEFFEIDVALLGKMKGAQASLDDPDLDTGLRAFAVLFSRKSFMPQEGDPLGRTFHEIALEETRLWESRVSEDLGARVFNEVFPRLANALAAGDPDASAPYSQAYLAELRDATLVLLYRLLFVLYAEDRDLLPVHDARYEDYSLRKIRLTVAQRLDGRHPLSETSLRIWQTISDLFRALSIGDASIGLPAYNGGLFEAERTSIIRRARVPDAEFALILDALSRRDEAGKKLWINYRDLSVQHLGSVYERLLEFRLEHEVSQIVARPQSFARRVTGTYFTHDDLVKLILRSTIKPLIDERIDAFVRKATSLLGKNATTEPDLRELDGSDPAQAILSLRICDPAMGSGHFLVSLVDYLADQVLETVALAEVLLTVEGRPPTSYRSPVLESIAEIRKGILASAEQHHWIINPAQLDDRHIVRRMILKRVIFGVDKNPMAVELAKVALWLHTFTVGAPLSFLDHHLRCGDSLHGESPDLVLREIRAIASLLQESELERIRVAAATVDEISAMTDIDIAEAHRSKELLEQVERSLEPLRALLDFWRALRWLIPRWSAEAFRRPQFKDSEHAEALVELFSGRYGLLQVLSAGLVQSTDLFGSQQRQVRAQAAATELIARTRALAAQERFFHWPLAFPAVWSDSNPEMRGFDAVIGNPPWDRMKLQEVEWFAERRPSIALQASAADRARMVTALQSAKDPLWEEFQLASETAATAARVVRESGDFPLLSGGDINLYSLFVERALALIRPSGLVGLLTPSGIAADKGAAEFFKAITVAGRLGALFDFENRKVFFPDIDSRFKFCVLVFSGPGRVFEKTACAFYLHSVEEIRDPEKILGLAASDFEAVNPNTGGAPIFRSRRDAAVATSIYRRFPVLVDRRTTPPSRVWPIRYMTMFHMTNDAALFKRADELEAKGWYRVDPNAWKKAERLMLPLYEGKMVQAYDHRAAHVVINPENIHRAAQPRPTTLAEHQDPRFAPTPQYWVDSAEVERTFSRRWTVGFKDVTAPTNVRTMIASVLPVAGYGNTLPYLEMEPDSESAAASLPLLLANWNSLPFDYFARQKVQGQHLNWYIVEQLPMIPANAFDQRVGRGTLREFIAGEVLRLSFTAHDLDGFAADLGYSGPPFTWDEEDRRQRLARLDALFFHLYGISRDDAAFILDSFLIVRDQDEAAFGFYRTKELVLGYMNAVGAGDLSSVIADAPSPMATTTPVRRKKSARRT